jgi:hypothetical protein
MNLVLPVAATPEEAVLWLRQLVRDFGLGFHLDSAPEDYVTPKGQPCFTAEQCAALNESLDHLFVILGEDGRMTSVPTKPSPCSRNHRA